MEFQQNINALDASTPIPLVERKTSLADGALFIYNMKLKRVESKKVNIPGYEESYCISSDGIVFSKRKHKSVNLHTKPNGYVYVILWKNGKYKNFYLHRLMAICFNKPNLIGGNCINHIDGNKKNNYYYNLEWCTRDYNNKHAIKIGLASNAGVKNGMSKLKYSDVIEIRNLRKYGLTCNYIASLFCISQAYVSSIATNKRRINL